MKNIIEATRKEWINRLNDFKAEVNKIRKHEDLNTWRFNDLMPKGKTTADLKGALKENKAYLIGRKEKEVYKKIEQYTANIKSIFEAGNLVSAKISLEWTKSRTWGACPKGEAWVTFINKEGHTDSKYVTTGSVTGCGFDKTSTAVANLLNQVDEVLKPFYIIKDKKIKAGHLHNHAIFGYGSGYGIEPRLEGGVGVSCYPKIFDTIGYKFETVASGKNYDVYTITKK